MGNDQPDFATYTKENTTGFEYANQRYYSAGMGRFLTADRSSKNVSLFNPASWNRFTYGNGDPANQFDPTGLDSSICYYTQGAYVQYVCISVQDGQTAEIPDDSTPDITNTETVNVTATPLPPALNFGDLQNNPPSNGQTGQQTGSASGSPANSTPVSPTPVCYQGGCIIPGGPPVLPSCKTLDNLGDGVGVVGEVGTIGAGIITVGSGGTVTPATAVVGGVSGVLWAIGNLFNTLAKHGWLCNGE